MALNPCRFDRRLFRCVNEIIKRLCTAFDFARLHVYDSPQRWEYRNKLLQYGEFSFGRVISTFERFTDRLYTSRRAVCGPVYRGQTFHFPGGGQRFHQIVKRLYVVRVNGIECFGHACEPAGDFFLRHIQRGREARNIRTQQFDQRLPRADLRFAAVNAGKRRRKVFDFGRGRSVIIVQRGLEPAEIRAERAKHGAPRVNVRGLYTTGIRFEFLQRVRK